MRDSLSSSAVMRTARGPAAGPGAEGMYLRAERRRWVSGRVLSRGRADLVARVDVGIADAVSWVPAVFHLK